jgi:hypothetical protein
MWASLVLGIASHQVITQALTGEGRFFADGDAAFAASVFFPTSLSFLGMWCGSLLGPHQPRQQLDRFYAIMNTAIGAERRLVTAGIKLPAMVDAGLVDAAAEQIDDGELDKLTRSDAEKKWFGPRSHLELHRGLVGNWYARGFVLVTASCVGLVVGTWLVTRLLFVWSR